MRPAGVTLPRPALAVEGRAMTSDENIARALLPLQFIVLALLSGIVVFSGATIYLVTNGRVTADPGLLLPLGPAVGLFALAEFVGFVFVRRGIMDALRRVVEESGTDALPPARLLASFRVLTIIGAAMAEGVSLFGVVVVLLTGNWAAFAVAAVGLLVLVRLFPTRGRYDAFTYRITGAG
jgi:hypothetical protein